MDPQHTDPNSSSTPQDSSAQGASPQRDQSAQPSINPAVSGTEEQATLPKVKEGPRVFLSRPKSESGVLDQTYRQILPRFGFPVVDSPKAADVVITDNSNSSQRFLSNGYAVVQLVSEKMPGGSKPSQGLQSHPEYGSRYRCVDMIGSIVMLFAALEQTSSISKMTVAEAQIASVLSKTRLEGKSILVVDNQSLNLDSARLQFGTKNSVTTCQSYKEALDLLKQRAFDVALLDLLMPPESFMLSEKASQAVLGTEFPAGIFTALIVANAGVKDVYVVTDASHHDHPATAMVDYLGWDKPLQLANGSSISMRQAHTLSIPESTNRIKDWSASIQFPTNTR